MAISLDFAAAAPFTYNHATGGGAWDDKTIGKNNDVVESLEGGDFACGDIVTFFVQITGAEANDQTIEIDLEFLAASTGQPGVAIGDITNVQINYGDVGGEGPGGRDSGIIDDGGSNATLTSEGIIGTKFDKPATLNGTVRVTDLDVGETLILRIDTKLECDDDPTTSPTGTLQGAIKAGRIVGGDTINVGNQTVPFLNVDDIVEPPPPPDDPRFTLDKQADVSSVDSVGDVITYTYIVDNTGDVDLTGVTVTDDRLGTISGPSSGDDGDGVLETNEVWTYTKTYAVTQNDLDNLDNIVNVATADTDRTDPKTDTVTVDVVRNPALNIEKFVNGQDADSPTGPLLLEGADVKFTYEITNTGNVTLTDFQLTDDKLGTITNITSKGDGDNLFEVGETWKYEATAKAVDGQYTNIGTATAV